MGGAPPRRRLDWGTRFAGGHSPRRRRGWVDAASSVRGGTPLVFGYSAIRLFGCLLGSDSVRQVTGAHRDFVRAKRRHKIVEWGRNDSEAANQPGARNIDERRFVGRHDLGGAEHQNLDKILRQ